MAWIVDVRGQAFNAAHAAAAWTATGLDGDGYWLLGVRFTGSMSVMSFAFPDEPARDAAFAALTSSDPDWNVGTSNGKIGAPDGSETYGWAYAIAAGPRPVPVWKAYRLRGWDEKIPGKRAGWRFLVEGINPAMREHVILLSFDDHAEAMTFVRGFVPNFPDVPETK
jgi:hypothetical protein